MGDFVFLYPFDNNPTWADIKPIYQSNKGKNIVNITTSKEFEECMAYFRAVLQINEVSDRAYALTLRICQLNSANYTAWHYRRVLIRGLKKDLDVELEEAMTATDLNPKNYQVWYHRRALIEMIGHPRSEYIATAQYILDDTKNYHVWSYRQWLLTTFPREISQHFLETRMPEYNIESESSPSVRNVESTNYVRDLVTVDTVKTVPIHTLPVWFAELQFVDALLNLDIRNNSAWNQRVFVIFGQMGFKDLPLTSPSLLSQSSILQSETKYTLDRLRDVLHNESPWVYLQHLTSQTTYSHALKRQVLGFCKDVTDSHTVSFALSLVVHLLSNALCPDYSTIRSGSIDPNDIYNYWWGNGESLSNLHIVSDENTNTSTNTLPLPSNIASAIEICDVLVVVDPVRFKYWLYRKQQLKQLTKSIDYLTPETGVSDEIPSEVETI